MLLLSSADYIQNQRFQTILSGTLSECQRIWIQIVLSILVWVQAAHKCYQQIARVAASKEKVLEQIPIDGLAHDEISVLILTCRTVFLEH